jgi:RNA recognition motif-containing protein
VARNELEGDASSAEATSTIFVGNISRLSNEDELAQAFAKFGQVTGVEIHHYYDGRSRGSAHVHFASKDSAVAAAKEPINLADRELRVEFRLAKDPTKNLYFKGSATGEPEIRTIFEQFNDSIIEIEMLRKRKVGVTSGFVRFNSVETATDALKALDGTQTLDGKPLILAYARPKPEVQETASTATKTKLGEEIRGLNEAVKELRAAIKGAETSQILPESLPDTASALEESAETKPHT